MTEILNDLIINIDKIHTTEMGEARIKRNLNLTGDVINFCKQAIFKADKTIRKGKNWYVYAENTIVTVNARSYTVITAHIIKPDSKQNPSKG